MEVSEEKLESAVRDAQTRARDQARRQRWAAGIAGSYAVDTVFLALFAAADTIALAVPLAYGVLAAAISVAAYAVTASGINLRARDPNLTAPLTSIGVAMQLGVVAAAPQIAFPYLANLFTVFAFGMIWMSVRQSVGVWAIGVAATGALFYVMGERLAMPVATPFERILAWSYFSLILGRCLLLSVQSNDLRRRLSESRGKLAASLEHVQQLASHDELTRVLNRRSLIARLEQERSRAERTGVPFSVALIDLDRFKLVNDNHGHAVGDEVLKAFAATVQATMRDTDVFGRYGGEEFLLVLTATAPAAALHGLERIRAALPKFDWNGIAPGLRMTASMGVAGLRRGETVAQLLNRADTAMYEAKRGGRDRVVMGD